MILAGDVGGTKVHLALYQFRSGQLEHVRDQRYPAREYSGLEQVIREFLGEAEHEVTSACFGVPGPVRDGALKLTNLPWVIDSRVLSSSLNIPHVFLINDLEANGYGIAELTSSQFFTLSEGDASQVGNKGLVSAGTGLGESMLIWNGRIHVPIPSEGGHCDFPARTEEEIDMLRFLQHKYQGRISVERVVSGLGLTNVYDFLRDGKGLEEPAWLRDRMASEDPNAVISELALANTSEICSHTIRIFIAAYGAEAGNLGLKALTVGGMYIGGGIAPRILDLMKSGGFYNAFTDKGRLSDLLIRMPVRVILEPRAALMGAAAYAEHRAADLSGTSPRAASIG